MLQIICICMLLVCYIFGFTGTLLLLTMCLSLVNENTSSNTTFRTIVICHQISTGPMDLFLYVLLWEGVMVLKWLIFNNICFGKVQHSVEFYPGYGHEMSGCRVVTLRGGRGPPWSLLRYPGKRSSSSQ